MKTFADYETPLVTDCFGTIADWASPKIEALRNAEMSADATKHVQEIIVALTVEMDAHRQAFVQMS